MQQAAAQLDSRRFVQPSLAQIPRWARLRRGVGFLAQAMREFEALMSLRRAIPILPQAVTGFGPGSPIRECVKISRNPRHGPPIPADTNRPTGAAELEVDFILTGLLLWFHAEIRGIMKYRTTRRLDRSWHGHTTANRTDWEYFTTFQEGGTGCVQFYTRRVENHLRGRTRFSTRCVENPRTARLKHSQRTVMSLRSLIQWIEATHSPTTTISGPSWGATGMGA